MHFRYSDKECSHKSHEGLTGKQQDLVEGKRKQQRSLDFKIIISSVNSMRTWLLCFNLISSADLIIIMHLV